MQNENVRVPCCRNCGITHDQAINANTAFIYSPELRQSVCEECAEDIDATTYREIRRTLYMLRLEKQKNYRKNKNIII